MKLLGNRVHARPIAVGHIASILLPEGVKFIGHYQLWRVLQVGPGRTTKKGVCVPIECQAGDRIVTVTAHTGPHQQPDGTAILVADEILCVITGI